MQSQPPRQPFTTLHRASSESLAAEPIKMPDQKEYIFPTARPEQLKKQLIRPYKQPSYPSHKSQGRAHIPSSQSRTNNHQRLEIQLSSHTKLMSRLRAIDEAGACLDQASLSRGGYCGLSLSSTIPSSTLAHRNYGRLSKLESTFDQQYLTPQEEEILVKHLLSLVQKGHRCPDLFLRKIVQNIRDKRNSTFHTHQSSPEHNTKLPGKNWLKALRSRHRELEKAWATIPKEKTQCGKQTCNSIGGWLEVIEAELDATRVLAENTYSAISTGVILEFPWNITKLMNDNSLRAHLIDNEKGTVITAIECTTTHGLSLEPWIIWPSPPSHAHNQRDRGLPATAGWHQDRSIDGYLDRKTTLAWFKEIFEPQTAARANGKLRVLISDALTDYLTRDLRIFCQEKKIRLCKLHSLAAKKFQPYSEDCSERLQNALQSEFNQAHSKMKNRDKSIFTSAYSVARQKALEMLNNGAHISDHNADNTSAVSELSTQHTQLENLDIPPESKEDLKSLMEEIQKDLAYEVLSETTKHCFTKLFDVVESVLGSQGSTVPLKRFKFRKQSERLRLKR